MTTDEKIKEIIARMVLFNSYWGFLFSKVQRKPDNTLPSIMGVAPDRYGNVYLLYKPDLIEKTDEETIKLIIEHEGLHLLNRHISRLLRLIANEVEDKKKFQKSQVWNIAADCCANTQMRMPEKVKVGDMEYTPCLPKNFNLEDGKISEYYFYELLKRRQKNQQCGDGKKQKCSGDCENCELVGGIDDHGKWYNEEMMECPDLHSVSRKLDANSANIIRESVRSFKARGTLPSNIAELIDDILNPPKLPYHLMIKKLVKASRFSKFKSCSTRINRKRTYTFVIGDKNIPQISPFPGKKRDYTFDIGILIDTSGSMSKEEILEALSGIKNIIENDKYCKVTVIENDTQIQKEYEVKKVRDIQMNIKGRGGTTLTPGLERFKELNPDVLLAFTDGGCENINEIPRRRLPKKIIWVITQNEYGGGKQQVDRTGYVVEVPK